MIYNMFPFFIILSFMVHDLSKFRLVTSLQVICNTKVYVLFSLLGRVSHVETYLDILNISADIFLPYHKIDISNFNTILP